MRKTLSVERIGYAKDLSKIISLIISEKNQFMNGSIINIDGGMK